MNISINHIIRQLARLLRIWLTVHGHGGPGRRTGADAKTGLTARRLTACRISIARLRNIH